MRRVAGTLGLAVGLSVMTVPPAAAAGPSITNADGRLTIVATEGVSLFLTSNGGALDVLAPGGVGAVAGCTAIAGSATEFRCPGVDLVVFEGSAEEDQIDGFAATVAFEIHGRGGDDYLFGSGVSDLLDGGPGADTVVGSAGNDVILGGTGDDYLVGAYDDDVVLGGDGVDRLWGDAVGEEASYPTRGDDVLDGEAGDDLLFPQGGTDVVRGGPGTDVAAYVEAVDPVFWTLDELSVTLDRMPNDGPPGEHDNVGPDSDVENVALPHSYAAKGVVAVGDHQDNTLSTSSGDQTPVLLDGRGGNDLLLSGGGSGQVRRTVTLVPRRAGARATR